MPILEKLNESTPIVLPPRLSRVIAQCDVLVVGGGPAGLGAAMGAADAGAETILVERYGFLGGNATAALTIPFAPFHKQSFQEEKPGTPTFFPADHGPGPPAIAGALSRLVERLIQAGGAIPPSPRTGFTLPFDPEVFKWVALELIEESGVKLLFHALASDLFFENGTPAVIFETKSGPLVVKTRVLIDCTGDGDLAARAGAPFEMGREEDGLVQPMTLLFRMGEFQKQGFDKYIESHPEQWRGVHGLWDLIDRAAKAGELDLPREDLLIFGTPHEREVCVNSTRVVKVFGTDVWDLTYAEWESRRQMRQIVAFLKRRVPGFEESYLIQSGVHVGVRETRRIIGEYVLTGEDILHARKFEDVIAQGTYSIDIHNPKGKGTVLKRLPPGEAYHIPLRSLLPKGPEHIVVAGRCISGTHEAHSSYRVMPIAMATGQAAGVCAALAARLGKPPRGVATEEVQKELVRQGADLGS
jgi:hypothetical protein